MNRKLLIPSILIVIMFVSCTMAGGKDGDTIIIGEDGGIVYKGGKKVRQLFQLNESN